MTADSFGARSRLAVGDASYDIFRLDPIDGFGAALVQPEGAAG